MRVTIKEVATEAQVSIATVSRVINDKGYISSKTRNRVNNAMRKLNYKPNIAARKLHGKQSKTIGIIIPTLNNPLFSELFDDIEKHLNTYEYQTLLCTTNNSLEKEKQCFELLKSNQVEGIITSSHTDFLDNHTFDGYPVVSFDRITSNRIPVVKSDNLNGGRIIAKRILEMNKSYVLILSGTKDGFYKNDERIKGMLSIFRASDISIGKAAISFASPTNRKLALIEQILSGKKYDAICCTDDVTALLVNLVCTDMNYHPLVTGYDGSKSVRTLFPNLITVKQPIDQMAKLMCDILIKRIQYPYFISKDEYSFPATLIN
ncbi:LacI family DNA-binding transcriptional regulator [Companilactobacillus huachuanensis]|uniref:LacI family DNA-binding transcriptional regulator n=1 Tax=Companilactobacillus huachuanensis TaxID=2559914 RepID=A0ABW1RQG0_9LACO|nr:LacI family DNA-binding transcriptional regulator [Companilactobacillus huachuanensis]